MSRIGYCYKIPAFASKIASNPIKYSTAKLNQNQSLCLHFTDSFDRPFEKRIRT